MTVSSGLFDGLRLDAGVAALVVARIYPKTAPQGVEPPYIVFHLTGDRPSRTFTGPSLSRGLWQCDAWSEFYSEAEAIALAIKDALGDFNGALGGRSLAIAADNSFDDYEPATDLYRYSVELAVWDCGPT